LKQDFLRDSIFIYLENIGSHVFGSRKGITYSDYVMSNSLMNNAVTPSAIFVPDSCFLLGMCSPITSATTEEPRVASGTFLELLHFLGRNGFSLRVPEMVAYEAAQILRDGLSLNRFFKSQNVKFGELPLADFFRPNQGDAFDMAIVPPTAQDQTPAASVVRRLWRISQTGDTIYHKRSIMSQISREERSHFGERAAIRLMNDLKKTGIPIFFLSEDNSALNEAYENGHHILTVRNFIEAISEARILPKMGLPEYTKEELLIKLKEWGDQNGQFFSNTNVYHQNSPSKSAFATLLHRIEVVPPALSEPAPPTKLRPGVDRFEARYKKFLPS
jgi:hypothetical protein